MKSRDVINLKLGQEFYIVLMSSSYAMWNPFIRTQVNRPTYYHKPLGIFKTSLREITENSHKYDWTYFKANFDTTEFEHLMWRGRWDDLPEGKEKFDYAESDSDSVYCMVYDDEGKKNPHEFTSENMFFTYDEAKAYYDKKMKQWKKNMKSYITGLGAEISNAEQNIKEARETIDKFSKLV